MRINSFVILVRAFEKHLEKRRSWSDIHFMNVFLFPGPRDQYSFERICIFLSFCCCFFITFCIVVFCCRIVWVIGMLLGKSIPGEISLLLLLFSNSICFVLTFSFQSVYFGSRIAAFRTCTTITINRYVAFTIIMENFNKSYCGNFVNWVL